MDQQAVEGNWGDKSVFASNVKGREGTVGENRPQIGEIRERLIEIYEK
jgi:hypothetical protein